MTPEDLAKAVLEMASEVTDLRNRVECYNTALHALLETNDELSREIRGLIENGPTQHKDTPQ